MEKVINIRKGLNIKMKGEAPLENLPFKTEKIALIPDDFRWIVPKLYIQEGDKVKVGTTIFVDKEKEHLQFVSPVSGTVSKILRGDKRKIEFIEINSDGNFESESIEIPSTLNAQNIKETLLKYGLWQTIRELPFNVIANSENSPKAVFISGFDTNPLAPDFSFLIDSKNLSLLQQGVDILKKLTSTTIYLSLYEGNNNDSLEKLESVEFRYFKGKHPAGNIATQIHHIDPINKGEQVWHIDLQSLIMIGKLFGEKRLDFSKRVAITGVGLKNQGYISLIQGACLENILINNLNSENSRIISGNILNGKRITQTGFLGFYHHQLTVIPEGGERRFMGWMEPGFKHWSYSHAYLSWLFPKKVYKFDTSLNGGVRPVMFNTYYDKVFPFDIMPVQLLKSCIAEDVELMENLGIYEVTEEDFALCEVICPSKIEWQEIILKGLTLLKE